MLIAVDELFMKRSPHNLALLWFVLVVTACSAHSASVTQPPLPPTAAKEFVASHGARHVSGGHVVDAAGAPLQLRGMSLIWSQWSSFHSQAAVDQLVDDWHSGLVRVPLGIEEDGYLAHVRPSLLCGNARAVAARSRAERHRDGTAAVRHGVGHVRGDGRRGG